MESTAPLRFDEEDVCEKCGKETLVNRVGICRACLEALLKTKADPYTRAVALKKLDERERGVILMSRMRARGSGHQRKVTIESGLEKRAIREDAQEQRRLVEVIESTPEELTAKRPSTTLHIQIAEFNEHFFRYLEAHPNEIHKLTPRRFEELIAEILKDMGAEVNLIWFTR
jgi:hypothetical protein